MALFANLYVGSSGLRTAQNAMNTTAHNMANIGTVGYTRQQVTHGTAEYTTQERNFNKISYMQTGLGVEYNNTKYVRSMFLDKSYRLEGGRSAFYEVAYNTMTEVEDLLQEMNGAEFKETLANLWSSIQELSKDPMDAALQTQFINRANEFVLRGRAVYQGFQDYQDRMNNSVAEIVEQINRYGEELVELNHEISRIECAGVEHANDLRDRRNHILDELGKLGDIEYEEDPLRIVTVQFEGVAFVMTDKYNSMGLDRQDSPDLFYTPYWEFAAKDVIDPVTNLRHLDLTGARVFNLDLPVSSDMRTDVGKLRSTLLARGDHYASYHDIADDPSNEFYNKKISQSIIMNIEAEFDMLFHNVCEAVNDVMRNAQSNPATVSGRGNTEDYIMFQVRDDTQRVGYEIAGDYPLLDLSVSNTQVNPELLKSPTTFGFRTVTGEKDDAATEALKAAFTAEKYTLNPNVATRNSLNGYYTALVSQVATSGSVYKGIMEFQEVTVKNIGDSREEIVGVNRDEELQFMIQFQNAFNASSRYINVVTEMLDHLLNSLA